MPSHRFITNQKIGDEQPLNQSFVRKLRNFINNFTVIGGNFYFDGTTPKLIISPSSSKYLHPFIVSSAGYGVDGLPQVSVGSGVFIAGLHSRGYYPTPTGIGTIIIDSTTAEMPSGLVEMAKQTVGGIALSAKTAILFSVDYILKGCKQGVTTDDPLTVIIADPGNTNLYFKQWYCDDVDVIKSTCTEAEGSITLSEITFAWTPAFKLYFPIAIVETNATGITSIRQIIRSDFTEPFSGSLEAS
jgi:hypothetical protein